MKELNNIEVNDPVRVLSVKNQWQQALYYLINWDEFSLADVIHDAMFYKFQTRLGEIEQEYNVTLCERNRKNFTNRFGKESSHTVYKCIDKEKCRELFYKYD